MQRVSWINWFPLALKRSSWRTSSVKLEDVQRVLGSAPEAVVAGIAQSVITGDAGAGLRWINEALDGGVEARQLTREVLEYLRGLLLIKNGGAKLLSVTPEAEKSMTAQAEALSLPRLLRAVRLFNGASNLLKTGIHTQLPLEMALVEASLPDEVNAPVKPPVTAPAPRDTRPAAGSQPVPGTSAHPVQSKPVARPTGQVMRPAPARSGKLDEPPPEPPDPPELVSRIAELRKPAEEAATPTAAPKENTPQAAAPPSDQLGLPWLTENWGRVLQAVRAKNKTVEAYLKSCEPVAMKDGLVTLGFYHTWHRDRISEDRNRKLVEDALSSLAGKPCRVECKLYDGNREAREKETKSSRREALLNHPVIRDAIDGLGAVVVDVQ